MRGARISVVPTLGALFFLCLPSAARAESDEAAEAREPRPHRTAKILLDMNDAVRQEHEEGGNFRIRKRYGFEYSHRFDRDAAGPIIFSVQGPALPRQRLGLSFEIRF
jgi:hypothetical protein